MLNVWAKLSAAPASSKAAKVSKDAGRTGRLARALESVEHREEIPIESRLLTALEDDVAVVDEDDRRRVLLCRLEDPMNTMMEVRRPADDRAVDEEELALQAMRERPADGRL